MAGFGGGGVLGRVGAQAQPGPACCRVKGRAGSVLCPGHPGRHPMVHLPQIPYPSSPPDETITVLEPIFRWREAGQGPVSGDRADERLRPKSLWTPKGYCRILEPRDNMSTRTPGRGSNRLIFSLFRQRGVFQVSFQKSESQAWRSENNSPLWSTGVSPRVELGPPAVLAGPSVQESRQLGAGAVVWWHQVSVFQGSEARALGSGAEVLPPECQGQEY